MLGGEYAEVMGGQRRAKAMHHMQLEESERSLKYRTQLLLHISHDIRNVKGNM